MPPTTTSSAPRSPPSPFASSWVAERSSPPSPWPDAATIPPSGEGPTSGPSARREPPRATTGGAMTDPEHIADVAMGYELMAIELEDQLERAERQGRDREVQKLSRRLAATLDELADVTESLS